MKIRTDFVTNSSSSSFVVEITIKSVEGDEFSITTNPFGEENQEANIECSASDVLKCDCIRELAQLLSNKVVVGEMEEETYSAEGLISDFFEEVDRKITSIDEIDTITFRRIWSTYGEAACCFGWNVESYAEELPKLAEKVCEAEGDEKEKAKVELQKYLSNYTGVIESDWGGCFPSGFMGAENKGAIVWNEIAEDIEEFAQMVIDEELPNDDYAIETTVIDMKSKSTVQTAEYILRRDFDEEDMDEEE